MIETRGLRKVYRTKKRRQVTTVDAVRGIDLTVAAGEIFGFLGPNGAGKTTTIDMILGLSQPTAGQVSVFALLIEYERTPARLATSCWSRWPSA